MGATFFSGVNKLFTRSFIIGTCLLTILPCMLFLMGIDFSHHLHGINTEEIRESTSTDLNRYILINFAGAFIHLLLEWSAVIIAGATAVLAFVQYKVTGNPITAIIGVALLCAGSMDAFHALAAINLIDSVADNKDFIPFTWAISRMFNAVILLIGVVTFLLKKRYNRKEGNQKSKNIQILSFTIFLVAIAYLLVIYCAQSAVLPQTMFPDSLITRPYDLFPLVVFVVMGIWLLPRFYKYERNVFSFALMWSMVPAVVTQAHMAFGSSDIYDAHFNISHALKAVSYLVPFVGIVMDYIFRYREEIVRIEELKLAHIKLEQKTKEQEQFTYIASHDLQEPVRTVISFSELLEKQYVGQLDDKAAKYLFFINEASVRMSELIKGLLDYSCIGAEKKMETFDCNDVIGGLRKDLHLVIEESNTVLNISSLPTIQGYKVEVRLLLQNLITNAIKFKKKDVSPVIDISCDSKLGYWQFEIKDNGIGIAEVHTERIFSIFQRLHSRDDYAGTGIGLAHCQKIVDLHNGEIWVDSKINEGAAFCFTIKKEE